MNTNERKILIFTSAAHLISHMYILIFPALIMPISRSFNISIGDVFATSFIMYLFYGLLAIPWGYISDRYGPRNVMGSGILLCGLGFIGAGYAQSLTWLTISLAVTGIGCAAYHPSGLSLLSKGIRNRGEALGINGLTGNVGIALAPLIAGILNYSVEWSNTFKILGVMGLILGKAILLSKFSVGRYEEVQKSTKVDNKMAVKLFILFCVSMVFSGIMYRGFTLILPSYLELHMTSYFTKAMEYLHFFKISSELTSHSKTLIASIFTSLVFFIGMAGQLVGGKVADKKELRWSYCIFFAAALPFLAIISFVTGPWIILFAGLFSFFALGMQPIENSLVAMITPPQWRSVSYGIKFTVVFGAGSVAIKLAEYIQKKSGINTVMISLIIPLLIVIFMTLLIIYVSRGYSMKHEK